MSRQPHRVRRVLTLLSCLAAGGCGGSPPETIERPAGRAGSNPESSASSSEPGIVVDVAGLVRTPGVYRMPPGARVHDAIQAAGGARRGAQLGALNRAAVLVDGQQVVVVAAGGGSPGPGDGGGGAAGAESKVSINSADVTQLDALPGVGPVTARKIVDTRESGGPFAGVEDLDRVPGIGPATIESLRDVVTT